MDVNEEFKFLLGGLGRGGGGVWGGGVTEWM